MQDYYRFPAPMMASDVSLDSNANARSLTNEAKTVASNRATCKQKKCVCTEEVRVDPCVCSSVSVCFFCCVRNMRSPVQVPDRRRQRPPVCVCVVWVGVCVLCVCACVWVCDLRSPMQVPERRRQRPSMFVCVVCVCA